MGGRRGHVTPIRRLAVGVLAVALAALALLGGAGAARAVNAAYRGVDFITVSSGWVVGRGALIMHTSNGGRTWVRQHREAMGPLLTDVSMRKDGLHGWAVGEGAAVYRTDDGRHWTRVSSMVLDPGINLTSVRFVNRSVGWVCGGRVVRPGMGETQWGAVYLSTDGGLTWSLTYSSPWFAPVALDASNAYTATCFGALNPGGENLVNQPAVARTSDRTAWTGPQVIDATITDVVPGDFDQAAPGRYVAVGGGSSTPGFALTSGNYGGSWAPGTLPASSATSELPGVKMVSASVGYAVAVVSWLSGPTSRVLKTTDGGVSWRVRATFRGEQLCAVDFTTASVGYVVGLSTSGAPMVRKTVDGGRHWARVR
jgi:photosystem II stability/assembly factor-like uncharacterized protein